MGAEENFHYNQYITKHNATYFSYFTGILFTSDSQDKLETGLWSFTAITKHLNKGFF